MKKLFLLSLVTLLFTACSSNSYKVNGKIYGIADDATIMLFHIEDGELAIMDSTKVSGESFSFSGKTDTCQVAMLSFSVDGIQSNSCTFFLEPGNIKIEYANGMQNVSGTLVNEQFQIFYDKSSNMNERATAIEMEMQRAETEADRESAFKKMEELQEEFIDIVRASIINNTDNEFGLQQLLESYDMFEPEELMEFIVKMEPVFGTNESFVALSDYVKSQINLTIGNKYIDFEAEMLGADGKKVKLSDYVAKNELVLIDFWASWCGPCRREIPTLKEAYAKWHSKGFEIVSVSVDANRSDWENAVAEEEMSWIQLLDDDSETGPATLYGVMTIPTTYLVNKEGVIIEKNLRGSAVEEALQKYLK
jgi:thiol-disulfide isomerase/thioredoxin